MKKATFILFTSLSFAFLFLAPDLLIYAAPQSPDVGKVGEGLSQSRRLEEIRVRIETLSQQSSKARRQIRLFESRRSIISPASGGTFLKKEMEFTRLLRDSFQKIALDLSLLNGDEQAWLIDLLRRVIIDSEAPEDSTRLFGPVINAWAAVDDSTASHLKVTVRFEKFEQAINEHESILIAHSKIKNVHGITESEWNEMTLKIVRVIQRDVSNMVDNIEVAYAEVRRDQKELVGTEKEFADSVREHMELQFQRIRPLVQQVGN